MQRKKEMTFDQRYQIKRSWTGVWDHCPWMCPAWEHTHHLCDGLSQQPCFHIISSSPSLGHEITRESLLASVCFPIPLQPWGSPPPWEPCGSFNPPVRQYQADVSIKEEPIYKSQLVCWTGGSFSKEDTRVGVLAKNHPSYKKQIPSGLVHPPLLTKEPFFAPPDPAIVLHCSRVPEVSYAHILRLHGVLMSLWEAKEKAARVIKQKEKRSDETRNKMIRGLN